MEDSQIMRTIKKVLPAVVTITISKYLPIFESPFSHTPNPNSPFGIIPPSGMKKLLMIPKGRKKIKVGGGSGFIADASGIILTNRHVIDDSHADHVIVLDGKSYKIEILAKDPINDVAVLKVDAGSLPFIELGDSTKLELGQTAIAIGNTLGTFQNTVSTGVISGLSREITAGGSVEGTTQRLKGLIQTDAAINPGNSGGPLIDIEGKAIGINAAMVFGAENVGFALPINTAKKALEDIRLYGKIRYPFLGVRYLLLDKELKEKYNLPSEQGALVISESIPKGKAVIPGSPAQKAGIKEGDTILAVNEEKISDKNSLEDCLQKCKIGKRIDLKVLRKGKEIICKAIIGEKE
jgi:serine protease Do